MITNRGLRELSGSLGFEPRRWSLYGAPGLQLVTVSGKSDRRGTRPNKRNPLRPVATGCLRSSMVRRGSTVRVRQRALTKCLQIGIFTCLIRKRLEPAGIRGLSLTLPRSSHERANFRVFTAIAAHLTPSVPEKAPQRSQSPVLVRHGPPTCRRLPQVLRTLRISTGSPLSDTVGR